MRLEMRPIFIALAAVAVGACAPVQKVMVFQPGEVEGVPLLAWPDVDSLPRLEYAGELVGELNFVAIDGNEGRGRRFLRWLAGLGRTRGGELRLLRPQTGVVDSTGRILVTDAGRPSVFVFDAPNGRLDTWQRADTYTNFVAPVGIAQDGHGDFLVSDAELGAVYRLAGDGSPLGRFDDGSLVRPTGLAVDAATGEVHVADTGAHTIKVYSGEGKLLRVTGVPGDNGDIPGTLNAPVHVTVAGARIYVSDSLNAAVQVFPAGGGEPLEPIGRRGLYVGNLVRPKGVTTDSDGNVYVVESYYDHLLVFNDEGRFLLPLGGTGAAPGQFFLPAGAWSDTNDRIFVADMFNGRVVIFRYRGRGQ